MIEKGRRLYGVGTHCQMCVLLDRGGRVTVNGLPKSEKADMKIVPKLLELVSSLRATLQVSELCQHSMSVDVPNCVGINLYIISISNQPLLRRRTIQTSSTPPKSRPLRGSSPFAFAPSAPRSTPPPPANLRLLASASCRANCILLLTPNCSRRTWVVVAARISLLYRLIL